MESQFQKDAPTGASAERQQSTLTQTLNEWWTALKNCADWVGLFGSENPAMAEFWRLVFTVIREALIQIICGLMKTLPTIFAS